MMMEKDLAMRTVTLKDLWDIFMTRWMVIVLSVLVVTGGFFAVNMITFTPEYESTATLYILKHNEGMQEDKSSDDFSLALKVVNDCNYLLKSHSVLDEVIQTLNLETSYEDLYNSVSTKNPSDTRILEVTVKSESPSQAKQIVDTICTIGTVKIEEAMGFQQVNLYEYGIENTEPANKTSVLVYLVLAVMTALFVYSVFFVAFLLDDRIRTDEDIERYLGLSILGDIPNANGNKQKGYGYYRAYGRTQYGRANARRENHHE